MSAANASIPHDSYYDLPLRIFGTACSVLILSIGVFGNTLVIAVVLTARSRMLTPTNLYLVSLALADLIALMVGAVTMTAELNVVKDRWVLVGLLGCKLSVYLSYVGVNTSAFSITAFSFERFIAICYPIRAQTVCTVRRAKRIIAAVWAFGLLYNSPWLYLATTITSDNSTTSTRCLYKLRRSDPAYTALYVGDLLLFYFLPLGLLSVLYCCIARVLFRSGDTACQGDQALRSSNANRQLHSRVQVVKMPFVVVVMFAVLWLPYRLMVAYNSLAPRSSRIRSDWYVAISRIFIFINAAINPIIYNAMSVKFRREFKRLLTCVSRSSRAHQLQQQQQQRQQQLRADAAARETTIASMATRQRDKLHSEVDDADGDYQLTDMHHAAC